MRRSGLILLYILLFVGASLPLHAQAPYRHSLGATLGTTQALSYKTFPTNHFALQIDLGSKYCYVYGNHLWSLELAPNLMYEGRLTGNLYGFVGGGISWGYALKRYTYYDAYGMQSSNINLKAASTASLDWNTSSTFLSPYSSTSVQAFEAPSTNTSANFVSTGDLISE